MSNAYIQNISMSQYSKNGNPSGSITIVPENGGHMCFILDDEDASKLQKIASAIVDKHKKKYAEEVAAVDTTPLIAYDSEKTIDNDDDISL